MNDTLTIEEPITVEVLPLVVLPTVEPSSKTNKSKLNELRDKVNTLHKDLENNEVLSRSHGKITLNYALKSGELLDELQDQFEYENGWKKWVEENIIVDYKTVRNYIRLWEHQVKHVSPYENCESLREAYIICGVVKVKIHKEKKGQPTVEVKDGEDEPIDEEKEEEVKEPPFETVKRNVEQLIMVFDNNPNHRDIVEMVKLLKPLVSIYNKHTVEENEENGNN